MANFSLTSILQTEQGRYRYQITGKNYRTLHDNVIELDINGIPSLIMIQYSGAAYFSNLMDENDFRLSVSNNKVIIRNRYAKETPKEILSYSGNITILDCILFNYDSKSIIATIDNRHQENILSESKTNLEDENLILYDDGGVDTERIVRGGSGRATRGGYRGAVARPTRTTRPSRPSRPTRRGGY